jgi:K+ transporter
MWKLLVQRPAAPGTKDPLLAPLLSGCVRGQSGIRNIDEPSWDLTTVKGERLQQMPGLGLYYTETSDALPATFVHAVHAMPAVFQSMVLLTVKMVPIPHVDLQERFLIKA